MPDADNLFDFDALFERLDQDGFGEWSNSLRSACTEALQPARHGQLTGWLDVLKNLPRPSGSSWCVESGHVKVLGNLTGHALTALRTGLLQLCPWRKGPFDLPGVRIDSEWRSDLKWDRVAGHVDWRNRRVLDVGCGNGYFGWRMLDAGAASVLGLDPFLLYAVQHQAVRHCVQANVSLHVLPLSDACLQYNLQGFDITVSMGVLYHHRSPIDHLLMLRESLRPGGVLLLETLMIDDPGQNVLVPVDRYAKMRNVWFLPSPGLLRAWLQRTGFTDIHVVDISRTLSEEQRRTDWMPFESLEDFLDPADQHRTIEGYPAPVRLAMTARRS